MILVDTNLLLYAAIEGAPEHSRAQRWLDGQLSNGMRVGLPWHSLLGFVRLASNRSVYRDGPGVASALQIVRDWLGAPTVWIPQPTEHHADVLDSLFAATGIGSRSVMDAHLAALAIEHGLTLCSNDNGFAQFKKLRWVNPLAEKSMTRFPKRAT